MTQTRRRGKSKVQDDENENDNIEIIEGGGFMIEKKKRVSRRKTAKKVKYTEMSSSDEDIDGEDDEYIPENNENLDEQDLQPLESDAENEVAALEDSEDIPLQQRSRLVKKKTSNSKQKKPRKKPDYFKLMTNRIYENHDELRHTFEDLQNIPAYMPHEAPHPKGMTIQLLPFQLEGLSWLLSQENNRFNGGVLADEMGMGKTIQTIALLMTDRKKTPNLVVAPPVAIIQWKNEIEAHTNNALRCYVYHGASRTNKVNELKDYDVILTTYSTLESVFRKQQYGFKRVSGTYKEKSVLHSIKFYRVILDEAHSIKDRQSGTAKSVNSLQCEKRWCLSGTPLQNRIGELYSLIRFLKVEPFCNYYCTKCECTSMQWNFIENSYCAECGHRPMQHTNFFNHFFLKNIIKHGITDEEGNVKNENLANDISPVDVKTGMNDDIQKRGVEAFGLLQLLLSKIMLRRTKVERADDLGLPPKRIEIRYDLFNPEEKDLYQSLYSDSTRQFNDYLEEGVVLNNYANIFTLITRMRQLADHPDLVLKRLKNHEGAYYEGLVCELCDDEAEDAIESKCKHKFCRLCISEYVESYDVADNGNKPVECPVCHVSLSIDLQAPSLEIYDMSERNNIGGNKKQNLVSKINMAQWKSSTKIEALVEELYRSKSDNSSVKTIVYSQFTSFLDLIDWRVKRAGFKTVRLQGSMTPQQRANTIKYFMENSDVEVFLVSLKAGGVSLNLTEANQIFILDPWWNPGVELQSDRVHRILQTRPVRIVKFCIADSIEKKILELQEKKADMVNATIGGDESSANRLTPADLQFLFST